MISSIKGTVTVDSREDNKHGLICISLLFKRMLEVQTKLKTVAILYTEVHKINSNLIKQLPGMSLYLSEDEIFFPPCLPTVRAYPVSSRTLTTDRFTNALQGADFWKRGRFALLVWMDVKGGFWKRLRPGVGSNVIASEHIADLDSTKCACSHQRW